MPLKPEQTVAHYRIDRKIGEGGMGEVWAATDTRLNRLVAIKSLPASVANDEMRLGRFKREAQLLAALSHPNIAAIYGLEQVDDALYLALELVDGEDLSARIEGRPVPYDEVVEIALQIADGLEEAHSKSIIHRDLKPANIKLSSDGKVKVLDFGLAKALSEDPNNSFDSLELSSSPTMTAALGTQVGMILGTAGYMAPEQARGKSVDRRADIWAFGVILFEMLTGQRLYHGETVTDIIAAVVTREPDWEQLPADTPVAMRRVLRRCLQKDPRNRLRDIGDAALELRELSTGEGRVGEIQATASSPRRAWILAAMGLVLGLILATAISNWLTPAVPTAGPIWSNLVAPPGVDFVLTSLIELSPDGRRVVFVGKKRGENEKPQLWVRELDNELARPLPGTEEANQPFWSPDSQSIGYFAKHNLRRISASGGASTVLADAGIDPRGGFWGADGTILYVPDWSRPVFRVPETGGTPVAITEFNSERLELSHRWPYLLPDRKHFLFFIVSTYPTLNPEHPSEVDKSGLYVGSLDGGEPRLLLTARSRAVYSRGSLIFVDDGVLMAAPFDLASQALEGEPVALAANVTQSAGSLWGGALFSVSESGTLLFARGAPEQREASQLRWFDREGRETGTLGEVLPYSSVEISHDGTRVVAPVSDPADLWAYDLVRKTSTRFTFDPGNDVEPLWSPNDDRVLFQSSRIIPGQPFRPSTLFQKASSGLQAEEQLPVATFEPMFQPSDWSSDGNLVALTAFRPQSGADILIYSFEAGDFEGFLETEHDEQSPAFSPDGRWIAYESAESGDNEVYVSAYPGPGGKWQVSSGPATLPKWRADGKELFYIGQNDMMSVTVDSEGAFRHDTPVALFKLPKLVRVAGSDTYAVAPDGQRFLFMVPEENPDDADTAVTLVQGWPRLIE